MCAPASFWCVDAAAPAISTSAVLRRRRRPRRGGGAARQVAPRRLLAHDALDGSHLLRLGEVGARDDLLDAALEVRMLLDHLEQHRHRQTLRLLLIKHTVLVLCRRVVLRSLPESLQTRVIFHFGQAVRVSAVAALRTEHCILL